MANHSITRFVCRSNHDYKRFLGGEGCLFMFGRVEYEDTFKRHRTTHFRMLNKDKGVGSFGNCTEGNDAD